MWFDEGTSTQNIRTTSHTVSRHQNPLYLLCCQSAAVHSHAKCFTDQRHYSVPYQSWCYLYEDYFCLECQTRLKSNEIYLEKCESGHKIQYVEWRVPPSYIHKRSKPSWKQFRFRNTQSETSDVTWRNEDTNKNINSKLPAFQPSNRPSFLHGAYSHLGRALSSKVGSGALIRSLTRADVALRCCDMLSKGWWLLLLPSVC